MNKVTYISPVGEMVLAADAEALRAVMYTSVWQRKQNEYEIVQDKEKAAELILNEACRELDAYFAGRLKKFSVPYEFIKGSTFEKKVWRELSEISYGETVSYKEAAIQLGFPKAYRAVANASAKNHLVIIIPCHRVISASGKLGGYNGGLKAKKFLIELEQYNSL